MACLNPWHTHNNPAVMIYAGEKCRSWGRSGEGRQQREEGRGPRAALLSLTVAPAA